MEISASQAEVFLYVGALAVERPARLGPFVELRPTAPSAMPDIRSMSAMDAGIVLTFLGTVESELRVWGTTGKETATRAWNAAWDILFINAIFDRNAMVNLQGDCSASMLGESSDILVTNYNLRGSLRGRTETLTDADLTWLEQNIAHARSHLDDEKFRNAVHCLATYSWHSLPRAQLALIWAGIEGMFDVASEIVFRLSVYAAQFLEDSPEGRKAVFDQVKRLYAARSKAVHGGKIKGDLQMIVSESAALLRQLIRRCIQLDRLPDTRSFAP